MHEYLSLGEDSGSVIELSVVVKSVALQTDSSSNVSLTILVLSVCLSSGNVGKIFSLSVASISFISSALLGVSFLDGVP